MQTDWAGASGFRGMTPFQKEGDGTPSRRLWGMALCCLSSLLLREPLTRDLPITP